MTYTVGTFNIDSREDAERILSEGQDPDYRPLENNTTLHRREDGSLAVQLHNTDVVTYLPDGRIRLDSGGWKTRTTKDRINRFAPVWLWQEDGSWYVTNKHRRNEAIDRTGKVWRASYVPFVDGMILGPNGGLPDKDEILSDTPNTRQEREKIATYTREFVEALERGEVPLPGPGDCWYCGMKDKDTGQPLGEVTGGDHIDSHIEESYFVPSLLYNAMEDKGYDLQGRNAIYLQIWSRLCRDELTSMRGILLDTAYRSIFTYLLRQKGLPISTPTTTPF